MATAKLHLVLSIFSVNVASAAAGGITCTGSKCTVTSSAPSPGTVLGGNIGGMRVDLVNVDIDCAGAAIGILASRRIKATDVTVQNCSSFGIYRAPGSPLRVRAKGLQVLSNAVGLELGLGSLKGTDVTVSDNSDAGVYSKAVAVDGITADNNGTLGVSASKRIRVANAHIAGNGTAGVLVRFGRARVIDSVVDGNGVDIAAAKSPKLHGTTCTTSRKIADGAITAESWHVCPGE
jgi:hypothetical protein